VNNKDKNDYAKYPLVSLGQIFKDDRGIIQPLVTMSKPIIQSAVMIESKKGTIRANHYHKTDWHYCYIISGSIEYYSRHVGIEQGPSKLLIKTGQLFYTPPLVEHAMVFPEDTVFLTLGGGTRLSEDYEADLVRVKLV